MRPVIVSLALALIAVAFTVTAWTKSQENQRSSDSINAKMVVERATLEAAKFGEDGELQAAQPADRDHFEQARIGLKYDGEALRAELDEAHTNRILAGVGAVVALAAFTIAVLLFVRRRRAASVQLAGSSSTAS